MASVPAAPEPDAGAAGPAAPAASAVPEAPTADVESASTGEHLDQFLLDVGDRLRTPQTVLLGMIAVYVGVFGSLTWSQQSNFGTFGFDMGIYDQGIWLLSRFRINPFDTVRGLPFFAHHVNIITLLFVPAYWLGAGPHFLYLVETLAMAAGAVPLWLLARDRLRDGWLALCPAGAYLLFPSLEWINWWHFHPDALIITPLIWAYWLADQRRWRWFAVAVGLALLCKEDAALAVFMLGLVIAWKQRRPWALVTAGAGAAWWFFATKVIIPVANGGGQVFYENLFPGFGTSIFSVIATIIRHPSRFTHLAFQKERITYYTQLLAPVALLPIGALPVLAIAGPQVLVNVISAHGYTHDIQYHYSSIVIAGIFLATVEALGLPRRTPSARRFLCGVLMATSLAGNVAWSPSPISVKYRTGIWARPQATNVAKNAAVAAVPRGAATSATYYFVPHLTHRTLIYEWPNPWIVTNWGVNGERPPDPTKVQWLVLDKSVNGSAEPLYDKLVSYQFQVVFEAGSIVVAHRVHPAGTGPPLG